MRYYKVVLVAGCLWVAAAAAVWPRTSFSGAGSDSPMVSIEKLSRDLSPSLAEVCRTDLLSFGRDRMRSLIAIGYPSSLRFALNSQSFGVRYLSSRCPVGPFLAMTSLVSEGADAVRRSNGSPPIYATP
jgi:hypothetical protein